MIDMEMTLNLESVLLSFLSFFVIYITRKVLELDKGMEVLKRELEILKELIRKNGIHIHHNTEQSYRNRP